MNKPASMDSIIITGPQKTKENVINELYALGAVHIVDHKNSEIADIGSPLVISSQLSEELVKLRSAISELGIKEDGSRVIPKEFSSARIISQVRLYSDRRKEIEDQIVKNNAILDEIDLVKWSNCPLQEIFSSEHLSVLFVIPKNTAKTLFPEAIVLQVRYKKKIAECIILNAKEREDAIQKLAQNGFQFIQTQFLLSQKGIARHIAASLHEKNQRLQKEREEIRQKMADIAQVHQSGLLGTESLLKRKLEKAESPLRFAETNSVFMVKGWIPSKRREEVMRRIEKVTGRSAYIEVEKANKNEKVPVKLQNKGVVKDFEFFLNMYSLPRYRELDPTLFIFLAFPLFFGFILGDIGYGLVTLAIAIILKKTMPKARSFFNIIIISAISSVVFGLLFGEVFGLEKIGNFELPHIISRAHQVNELMMIAAAIGIIHINIGFILGFINEYKNHGLKMAIYAKGSWILLQAGIALIALTYLKIMNISIFIGAAVAVISLVMIYKGEGIRGLVELPSILSNVLSYARLMAVGLSSVIIAVIVNDLSLNLFMSGGIGIVAAIILVFLGHTLNILLGLMGAFLHSLRLHYVEFFPKFFEGGAERYNPFGKKE